MRGQSPPPPAPLPLVVGQGYDSQVLLLLHAAPGSPAAVAAAAVAGQRTSSGASPEVASPASQPGSAGSSAALASAGSQPPPSPSLAGSASGSSSCTTVTAWLQPEHRQVAVELDAVALRLHAAGWEEAAQCVLTYAVLAEQAQRQYTVAAAARAASPLVARRAAAAAASLAPAAVSHGGSTGVRLHLHSLLVELLADGDMQAAHSSADSSWEPGDSPIPAATLQTALQVEAEAAADGRSRVRVTVPGLLLAVGVVPAGVASSSPLAPLALPLSDSLLGLHRLELSLVSQQQPRQLQPAATTAEGSVLLGPAHQVSVGATLAQASVWANPRNLCCAAALAGHAQVLVAELAVHLPAADFEAPGSSQVRGTPAAIG